MTMTDDRELLEAAARAAGIELGWDARGPHEIIPGISGSGTVWNPLTDDGDALRLAVKLGIDIVHRTDGRIAASLNDGYVYCIESRREEAEANTRRAIVRCAAASLSSQEKP
jgi:hypothetical protein